MGVTGSGTQSEPYLVSTVADIDMAFNYCRTKESAGTYYVQLSNDINGNWREWPIDIDYHTDSDRVIDFNLNNHEIVNFKAPNRMFAMAKDTFRNGLIYNIFRESGSTSYLMSKIKFNRMSVSAYLKESKSEILTGCEYKQTAVWLKVEDYNAQDGYQYHPLLTFNGYSVSDQDGPYQLDENDMMFLIDRVNTPVCVLMQANSSTSPIIGENCRIQGKITDITPAAITSYPAIMSSDVAVENSVVNMELPDYTGTVSSSPTTIIGTGTTGVINSDLIHDANDADYSMLNLIDVTDAQMHSADDLTNLGFEVYVVRT